MRLPLLLALLAAVCPAAAQPQPNDTAACQPGVPVPVWADVVDVAHGEPLMEFQGVIVVDAPATRVWQAAPGRSVAASELEIRLVCKAGHLAGRLDFHADPLAAANPGEETLGRVAAGTNLAAGCRETVIGAARVRACVAADPQEFLAPVDP